MAEAIGEVGDEEYQEAWCRYMLLVCTYFLWSIVGHLLLTEKEEIQEDLERNPYACIIWLASQGQELVSQVIGL